MSDKDQVEIVKPATTYVPPRHIERAIKHVDDRGPILPKPRPKSDEK